MDGSDHCGGKAQGIDDHQDISSLGSLTDPAAPPIEPTAVGMLRVQCSLLSLCGGEKEPDQEVSLFENQCIKNETESICANRLSRVKPLPDRHQPSSAGQRQLTLSRSS